MYRSRSAIGAAVFITAGEIMIILKIITIVLGLLFLLFGYLIRFRKKYDLINGFEADLREGRRDERYAERVGLIEFIIGMILILTGAALLLFV